MENPNIKRSQIIFGDVVYWFTIVAAVICTVGPLLSFISMDGNVINPHFLFANMWNGMAPEAIWETSGSGITGGHYWISNITAGDGFTQLGLVMGCSVAIPAMLVAAIIYAFRERSFGWAILALWIVGLVSISVLGIVSI